MNILKKFSKRAILGAMICGSTFFNSALAAPAPAIDGMTAFCEAITTPSKPDKRVFHEDIYFFIPEGHIQLEILGQTKKNIFRLAGSLEIISTNENGSAFNFNIPFHIVQESKNMTIYFNFDGQWKKFQTPSVAAAMIDSVVTPEKSDIEEEISMVKEVKVLRETDKQRTMLVKLDGNKLADIILKYDKDNPADKGTSNDKELHDNFMKYLDKGTRRADTWYIWTVDKESWQTITQGTFLSSIIQETARAALEDTNANWDPVAESILETIAYYSDFKEYTTFLNSNADARFDLPEEAKKAVLVNDLIPDEESTSK